MKRFICFLFACCTVMFLTAGVAKAQQEGTFRLGGGLFFDQTIPGLNASYDFPIGEGWFAISPFADLFYKPDSQLLAGGANLVWTGRINDKARFYVGGGGGVGYVSLEANIPGASVSASETSFAANVLGGADFVVGNNWSLFAQLKWIGTYGGGTTQAAVNVGDLQTTVPIDLDLSNMAIQGGLSIPLGGPRRF